MVKAEGPAAKHSPARKGRGIDGGEPNPAQSSLPFVIPSVADLSRRAVEGPAVSLDPTIMMGPMTDVGGLWRIGRLGRNFHPRHQGGNLRPNRFSWQKIITSLPRHAAQTPAP